MYHLIAIGDPIIDTHVQIADECDQCRVHQEGRAHLCLDYGAKIPIVDSFQALGGNAPNVAVGAVRLGLSAAVVSTVGRDAYGKLALAELKKQNVDTAYISSDPGHKTRYSIVLNYRGERTILSYSERKTYRWPKAFPETNWIYYTGVSEGYEAIQEALLKQLDKNPETGLAINPGSYLLKYGLADLRTAVARADLLLVNREEAEKIAGPAAGAARVDVKTEAGLIRALLSLGAKEVALTDGSRGAWAGNHEEVWRLPAYPVKVVSKTGAGDAFSAAYLSARWQRQGIAQALAWGTANSCSVVGAPGPHAGLLDQAGIKKMIKRFFHIQPTAIIE